MHKSSDLLGCDCEYLKMAGDLLPWKRRGIVVVSQVGQEGPRLARGNDHGLWWAPWVDRGNEALLAWPVYLSSGHYGLPVVILTTHVTHFAVVYPKGYQFLYLFKFVIAILSKKDASSSNFNPL